MRDYEVVNTGGTVIAAGGSGGGGGHIGHTLSSDDWEIIYGPNHGAGAYEARDVLDVARKLIQQRDEARAESASLRARPQEPGLSKEWLEELLLPIQRELYLATFKMIPQESIDWQCGFDAGSMQIAKAMIDAILSAPPGPLSDPEGAEQ